MDIAIIGGGASGISLAYYLSEYKKQGLALNIRLFDANGQAGGCIRSVEKDGYLVESGPNGVLANKTHFREIYSRAGLAGSLMFSSDLTTRRYIQLNNKLNLAPLGLLSAIKTPLLSFAGKLRVLKEPFVKAKADEMEESVYDFAARRLGTEAADNLVSTMIGGIYAGDAKKLSIKSAFPGMYLMEKEYGGLVKGMMGRMKAAAAARKASGEPRKKHKRDPNRSKLLSSATGLNGLVSELAGRCEGVEFHYNCTVEKLEKAGGRFVISTTDGEFSADKVISCCNAHDAAQLYKTLDAELAEAFAKVKFAPIFICGMGFDRKDVGHPLDGFGYLVAPKEGRIVLGTLFSSSLFDGRAPEGKVLVTSITIGDRDTYKDLINEDESALRAKVYDGVKDVLQTSAEPEFFATFRHERAIPQYYIGHSEIVDTINRRTAAIGGLYIGGNTTSGISVADCMLRSRDIASKIFEEIRL